MSVISSEWNSMVPKRHKYTHGKMSTKDVGEMIHIGNVHVLAPFKHSVVKSSTQVCYVQ